MVHKRDRRIEDGCFWMAAAGAALLILLACGLVALAVWW